MEFFDMTHQPLGVLNLVLPSSFGKLCVFDSSLFKSWQHVYIHLFTFTFLRPNIKVFPTVTSQVALNFCLEWHLSDQKVVDMFEHYILISVWIG